MKPDITYTIFPTKWGHFGLLVRGDTVVYTVLPCKNREYVRNILLREAKNALFDENCLPKLQEDIIAYYEGTCVDFSTVKTALPNTDFASRILNTCKKIKYGEIITYEELAHSAGHPNASRAAGTVLAKNRTPLIIPCHRIIRKNGQTGNFSAIGGTNTKQKMLELEARS